MWWLNFLSIDGEVNAAKEIKFFFPEFSCQDWYKLEEEKFRKRLICLDEKEFVHRLLWLKENLFYQRLVLWKWDWSYFINRVCKCHCSLFYEAKDSYMLLDIHDYIDLHMSMKKLYRHTVCILTLVVSYRPWMLFVE